MAPTKPNDRPGHDTDRPDQGLPERGQPGQPDQGLPGRQPGLPDKPNQDLPEREQPGRPDQGLPERDDDDGEVGDGPGTRRGQE